MQVAFGINVLASLVAGVIPAAAFWFVSQSWAVTALVAVSWIAAISIIALVVRRNSVRLIRMMSIEEAGDRIQSARHEIWSLQISGTEFTVRSIETYEAWLKDDRNRQLKIAFVDPGDSELLSNIVKLSGTDNETGSPLKARDNLRNQIETSLERYVGLRESFNEQVDLRVYDISPPYSIHAVDPDRKESRRGSLFIELYLPGLPQSARPCMLLPHNHAAYSLYRAQSKEWFEGAKHVPSGRPEPSGSNGR